MSGTLDKKIAELDKEIAERDEKIAELNKEIAQLDERDKEIAERSKKIAERDKEIAERNTKIAERDKHIAERNTKIAERDRKIAGYILKIALPIVAIALLMAHIIDSKLPIDTTVIGLLVVAFLPWLSILFTSLELPWLKVQFREIKEEQGKQREHLEYIRFLIANFLTKWEEFHLRMIAQNAEYRVNTNEGTFGSFQRELDHLRGLGLINNHRGRGLRAMMSAGGTLNVKDFFYVTERGKEYLKLRDESVPPTEDKPAPSPNP